MVTAANLNEQVRDNMNALSTHQHTGAAGDGARILAPQFVAGQRVSWLLPVLVGATAVDPFMGDVFDGSAYDATANWWYSYWTVSGGPGNGNGAQCRIGTCAVENLPQATLVLAQSGTHADCTLRGGMAVSSLAVSAEPADGCYFRAIGTGNWFAVTRASSTETTTDTGIAQSTTPREFRVVVAATNSVTFYIDNVLKATHATNIPAAATVVNLYVGIWTAATAQDLRIANYAGLSHEVKTA